MQPEKESVVIDPAGNSIKVDPSGNTVKVDPAANTVKVDPSANTVKVSSMPAVTGAVEVTKLPPVTVSPDEPLPVRVLSNPAGVRGLSWAVTADGDRCGFNATTGSFDITHALTPDGQVIEHVARNDPGSAVVAVFVNPADSGTDAFIDRFSLGSTQAGEWHRLRNPDEVLIVGDPVHEVNRGGGDNRAAARLYAGSSAVTQGGQLSQVTYTGQTETYNEDVRGTIVLRPGEVWVYVFDAIYGGALRVSVEIVWWEVPAES